MRTKKYLLVISFMAMFLLTGCAKTLTCTKNMTNEMEGQGTLELKTKLEYDSEGEILDKVTVSMIMNMTGQAFNNTELNELEEMFQDVCKQYGKNVSSCKVSRSGKKIILTASGDKDSLKIIDVYEDAEEIPKYVTAKKEIESAGYTCK